MEKRDYVSCGSVRYKVIERKSVKELGDIESGVKNKWRWDWLSEKDQNGDYLSCYLVKIDKAGFAYCKWCNEDIKYASSGKKNIKKHAHKDEHRKRRKEIVENTLLPSASGSNTCAIPYGTPLNVHEPDLCSAGKVVQPSSFVSFADRKAHLEAFICSFMCENSLSLSMSPKLIEFSKVLASDPKALADIHMERQTTTYKIVDGLAPVHHKDIIDKMRTCPFSINMDECTAKNGLRVFSILISYYDVDRLQTVTEHYKSFNCIKVDAKTIFGEVDLLFQKDEIPYKNLISDLSDSAGYMRGKNEGVEVRLCEKAPHLLDLGGDSCHDVHNIVKKFCRPFDNFVEKLWQDIHADVKYSPDILEVLKEICCILDISFRKTPQHVPHRWLSVYDATKVNLDLLPALRLLYYSWLPSKSRSSDDEMSKILDDHEVTEQAREIVTTLQTNMEKKKLTEKGLNRKGRIVEKLFMQYELTSLISNFFLSTLPTFKSFVLTFQQNSPQVHRLYCRLADVVREFFGCFLKHESITNKSYKELMKVELTKENTRKTKDIFYGAKNDKLLRKLRRENIEVAAGFMKKVHTAYVTTGTYIQKKLQTNTNLLLSLTGIDPRVRGKTLAYRLLKRLGSFFPSLLDSEDKQEGYLKEISTYQVDSSLTIYDDETMRLDEWWGQIIKSDKYPSLSIVVRACLSIFTAPKVESMFSMMGDIMNTQTNRMLTETFDGIMMVKYHNLSTGKKSTDLFKRSDINKDPVNPAMCNAIRSAHSRHKMRSTTKRKIRAEKKEMYGRKLSPPKPRKKKARKARKDVVIASVTNTASCSSVGSLQDPVITTVTDTVSCTSTGSPQDVGITAGSDTASSSNSKIGSKRAADKNVDADAKKMKQSKMLSYFNKT